MNHAITFDVEDWYQVFYGESIINHHEWEKFPSSFERMVDEILQFLEEKSLKATFFIVGWLAWKFPNLIMRIYQHGHEVASHGYWHKQVFLQSPDEFYQDLVQSKDCIEQAIGGRVIGYRAPGYSIEKDMTWAVELIKKAEYKYDSSLLFIKNGIKILDNGLIEVPPNSIRIWDKCFPVNGGFFFRAIPFWIYEIYLRYLYKKKENLIFYTHSWEIFDYGHRIPLSGVKRFVQYYNISGVRKKLGKLLDHDRFFSIETLLNKENVNI